MDKEVTELELLQQHILSRQRGEIRYQLYRLRTEAEGGERAAPECWELAKWFESQEAFTTWAEFARKWDTGPEGRHDQVVRRLHTEEQLWNMKLAGIAQPLPRLTKG